MHLVLPDGVTNATYSPSCVVTSSRVAVRNSASSAGAPARTQVVTAEIEAPAFGAADGTFEVAEGVVADVDDRDGTGVRPRDVS
ncbi:hypothetical protein MCNF_23720 [Mycolicibacterium confluentis]|uniref:Uncharacterized protein n=1 Tax=Mycolicibacterium confluentis TaxID=28047 RepID=A0A7I7XWY5_9MYCO|nr:hypothetical protein MCNF_23720 [Mycolicibacterium confluentis]